MPTHPPRVSKKLVRYGEKGWGINLIDNHTKAVGHFRTDETGKGLFRLLKDDEPQSVDADKIVMEWQQLQGEDFWLPEDRSNAHAKLRRLLKNGFFAFNFC